MLAPVGQRDNALPRHKEGVRPQQAPRRLCYQPLQLAASPAAWPRRQRMDSALRCCSCCRRLCKRLHALLRRMHAMPCLQAGTALRQEPLERHLTAETRRLLWQSLAGCLKSTAGRHSASMNNQAILTAGCTLSAAAVAASWSCSASACAPCRPPIALAAAAMRETPHTCRIQL